MFGMRGDARLVGGRAKGSRGAPYAQSVDDEHRARDWVVVRMMNNACWRLQDDPEVRRLIPTDEYLTACIAVAKAVQD